MNETFRPLSENGFQFRCDPDVSCFTECCARLQLTLTPYDILRMKHRLGLSSEAFLDQYSEPFVKKGSRFPMVKLKMMAEEGGRCPFVTAEGCAIYEDRPGACRLYPVGRASAAVADQKGAREKFFLVVELHCRGFNENTQWTLEEWLKHEGVSAYNAMNDAWLQILSSPKSLGSNRHVQQKQQMFFMASYNLDTFRRFVFESPFLKRFDVSSERCEKLASDDVELMTFGFEWLKFSLFGETTVRPRMEK
ncbi:MAG: YkgJ family cysteine cluster protein [Deltaproteobacteria bacterium]|nr:YkgJ family cysteine cluster protein [Deltaproteobacteria bacterium]